MAITQSDGVLAAKIKEADPSTKHKARSLGEQYIPPHRRGLDTSANTKSTNQRKPVANPGMEGSQLGSHPIQTKRKLTFEEKGKAPTKPVTKANVIIPQFRRNGIVLREPSSPSPVSLSDSSDCSSVGLERNKVTGSPSTKKRHSGNLKVKGGSVEVTKKPHVHPGRPSKSLELIRNQYLEDEEEQGDSEEEEK
ncbi:hypothetical protein LINPERHAP2_LOCUS37742, partial [Linum perenne]